MHARIFFAVALAASTFASFNVGCGAGDDGGQLGGLDQEQTPKVVYQTGQELEITADELNLLSDGAAGSTVVGVLQRGTIVVVTEDSGETGFVHVMAPNLGSTTAQGAAEETREGSENNGFVSGKYVSPTGAAPAAAATGGNCDPSGGANAVGKYQKALHDMIAFAEGTRGYSRDGYDVMYSYKLFNSCTSHPNQCLKFGSTCSTAAGRYQFLTRTWNGAKSARGLSTFEPVNQEKGAEYLVSSVRKVTVPQDRALTASEFSNMLSKLSYEWASLPPGRYGQPKKPEAVVRVDYCRLAGCDGQTAASSSSSGGSSGSSGSSGASSSSGTIPQERSCDGLADGYYCSTIDPQVAQNCRGGLRAGVTRCETSTQKCKAAADGRATISGGKLVCQ